MNLPNLISLGRLFCAPIIVWLIISQQYVHAFWLFCIAGLSDLIDGLLARILKDTTIIGKYLDPIADKTLLVSVIVSLGVQDLLPSWLVIIVVFRDVVILGGILVYMVMNYPIKINPILISKINTVLQIASAAIVLFQQVINSINLQFNTVIFLITAFTTVVSGLMYVYHGIKRLSYGANE